VHVLKELRGWADLSMVLLRIHLSSEHLQGYAGYAKSRDKFTTGNKKGLRFAFKALIFLELAMGIEPATG